MVKIILKETKDFDLSNKKILNKQKHNKQLNKKSSDSSGKSDSNSSTRRLSQIFNVDSFLTLTPSHNNTNIIDNDGNDSFTNNELDSKIIDNTLSLITSDNEDTPISSSISKSKNISLKDKIRQKINYKKEQNEENKLNKTVNDRNISNSTQYSAHDSVSNFSVNRLHNNSNHMLLSNNSNDIKFDIKKKFSINDNSFNDYNYDSFNVFKNNNYDNKFKTDTDYYNTNLRLSHKKIKNNKYYNIDINNIDKTKCTIMIKNIPNKYTKNMMLELINNKFKNTYDFFYLPIDFNNKCNMGYAFINFKSYKTIKEFYQQFNNKKFEKFKSEKICQITYARMQGPEEYIKHFKNSEIMKLNNNNYKPFIKNK